MNRSLVQSRMRLSNGGPTSAIPVPHRGFIANTVLVCCLSHSAFAQPKQPLTSGIERNQQYLQQYTEMLHENEGEQKLTLADLLADGTSLFSTGQAEAARAAGKADLAVAQAENALAKDFEKLGLLADSYGSARDGYDTGKDPTLSGILKDIVDVAGAIEGCAYCKALGISSTVVDSSVKATQLWFLLREHAQLQNVVTQFQLAQRRLLAKDPVTRARIEAAARKAQNDAADRQRSQSDVLRQYYRDKASTVELSVKNASDKSQRAFHVTGGISIVDPDQDLWDLSKILPLNPDFIAAMKCERDGLRDIANGGSGMVGVGCSRCRAGDPCNRYPDGSYINVLGPPGYDPTRSGTPVARPSTSRSQTPNSEQSGPSPSSVSAIPVPQVNTPRPVSTGQQRQLLVGAMNKAQAAHDQCVRKFLACADRNPDGGTAGCDNCDALDAAGWKAIQALADFDAKQGARQR